MGQSVSGHRFASRANALLTVPSGQDSVERVCEVVEIVEVVEVIETNDDNDDLVAKNRKNLESASLTQHLLGRSCHDHVLQGTCRGRQWLLLLLQRIGRTNLLLSRAES